MKISTVKITFYSSTIEATCTHRRLVNQGLLIDSLVKLSLSFKVCHAM